LFRNNFVFHDTQYVKIKRTKFRLFVNFLKFTFKVLGMKNADVFL